MHQKMAVDTGFEPVLLKSKFSVLPLHQSTIILVAVERIELSSNAYETPVLPLNYTAISLVVSFAKWNETPIHFVNCVTIELYNNKLVGVLGIEPRLIG